MRAAKWCLVAAFWMAAFGCGAALNGYADRGLVWVAVGVFLLLASVVLRVPFPEPRQPDQRPQPPDDGEPT